VSYTSITVKSSISSIRPAALVVRNGTDKTILDGVTAGMLRGLARVLCRAADHIEERDLHSADCGTSGFSMSYEIEWGDDTAQWDREDDTDD